MAEARPRPIQVDPDFDPYAPSHKDITFFELERKERHAKVGQVLRNERRSESRRAMALTAVLLILNLVLLVLIVIGLLAAWDQRTLALWIGLQLLITGVMATLYRKYFQRDVLVAKRRYRKSVPSVDVNWWSFK